MGEASRPGLSALARSLDAAHQATRQLPTDADVCALYGDAADRAEEVWPGALGVAIAGVLRLAREHRLASGLRGTLGEPLTTLALAIAVAEVQS